MKKITEQKARKAMEDWLNADIELGQVQAEKRAELTPIVQEFEKRESALADRKKAAVEIVKQYATEQRGNLFEDGKKSTEFGGGKIGFKTSPAKLQSDDWDVATDMMAKKHPEYAIDKVELDKKGILRNLDKFKDGFLATVGLKVVQEERFYIK